MPTACPGSSVFTNALRLLRGLRPTTRSSVGDGPARTSGLEGRARATWGGSHVPCVPISQDGRPTLPRQPRRAYAAGLRRDLPTRRLGGLRSRPPNLRAAVHCIPAHIRQVRGRFNAYGALHAGSSRTPSGLACRTRVVWQCRRVPSLSGLLAALPGVHRIGLSSASTGLLLQPSGGSLHPTRSPWRLVAHKQIIEPVMRLTTGPTVQHGLDLQYPKLGAKQRRLQLLGLHRRTSRHSSILAACLLAPFAMRHGFPGLGLLQGLRPTHGPKPATSLPTTALAGQREGDRGWFPRSRDIDRPGRWPALPRQHRHAYAAALQRGLPTDGFTRLRS